MAALPTLKESEPIISPQPMPPKSGGAEAFAKVLGGIAQLAEKKVESINEDQSKALALQASNSISDTVTGAQINMLNNPGHAAKIVEQSRDTINTILDSSFVNNDDRLKLKQISNSAGNQIDSLGAKTVHHQMIVDTSLAFHNELPKALMDIDRFYLSGDVKAAELRQNNLLETAAAAFKMGAITARNYETVINGISSTIEAAKYKNDMLAHGNATAVDYHKSNNTMYGSVNSNPASTPTDQYTTDNAAHYDSEASYQRIESDLYRTGHVTDSLAFNTKISNDKLKTLHQKWIGVNQAQSMIQAGTDYIRIDKEFKDLESKNKTGLTLTEEGKYNYLKNYYARLDNGEYLDVMRGLPQGARISNERASNDAAIESSTLSEEEKIFKKKENEDWERTQMINLGYGLHMNPKYIKVMDNNAMVPFKAGFQAGQNADLIISNLRATDPSMHPYIADAMDKQNQAAVLLMLGNAGNGITQGVARDMIYANQDGYDKTLINVDKDSIKFGKITGAIANDANVQAAISYMSLLPHDMKGGQSLPDGTITALANTVVLMAKRNGDLGVDNLSTYVSNLSDQVRKSYVMYQDQNMRVNNATLKLANADLKAIGLYAKDVAYNKVKTEKTPVEFLDYFDRSPLVLINTPNNTFVMVNSTTGDIALDKSGQPLFEWPYTDTLKQAAKEHKSIYDTEQSVRIRQFKETHPFGRTFQ